MTTTEKIQQVKREQHNLTHLGNAGVEGVVELGRKRMKLKEVRGLQAGKLIEIDKLAGEAFTLRLNGVAFAEGEVVVVSDLMALRLTRLSEYPAYQEAAP